MDFLEYWDKRIEEFEKNRIAIFNKPTFMNELCNEARQAWEAALSEKEEKIEELKKLLNFIVGQE